jgi:hypothetical protein
LSQYFDESLLAELFSGRVEGFGYTVGVERERVAGGELAFLDWRIPFFEETENGGGGAEPFDLAVTPEDDGGQMAAVGVAEAAGGVIVVGEEDGGVGGVGGVLEEEAVDGLEEELGLVAREGELAAEVGLEIGHEKCGSDAFAGDVADDEAEPLAAEGEEVVVVAADVAGLEADTSVVEGFERWESLRKEAGLDLAGDLELLCGTAIGFDLRDGELAFLLDLAGEFIGANQLETVAVDVLKAGKGDPEDRLLRWLVKAHTMSLPELVGGVDVLGDETDLGFAADETVFVGPGFGSNECEDGLTVRRSDCDPAAVVSAGDVGKDVEAELVDVEVEASFVIADINGGFEDAQVGALRTLRAIWAEWLHAGRGGWFEGSGAGCQDGSPLEEAVSLRNQSWEWTDLQNGQVHHHSDDNSMYRDRRGLD